MVKEMQAEMSQTGVTLVKIWQARQAEFVEKYKKETAKSTLEAALGHKPKKLCECHDFQWSRSLWKEAALEAQRALYGIVTAYLFFGYLFMSAQDPSIAHGEWGKINGWYFMSATVSTVSLLAFF